MRPLVLSIDSRVADAAFAPSRVRVVLMLISPYYEALTTEETVAYVRDVAAAVELPIMLYNIPAVTGLNLDPATVRRLATEVDNVMYTKDSSADWEQALRLIHHYSDVIGTFIGWNS